MAQRSGWSTADKIVTAVYVGAVIWKFGSEWWNSSSAASSTSNAKESDAPNPVPPQPIEY